MKPHREWPQGGAVGFWKGFSTVWRAILCCFFCFPFLAFLWCLCRMQPVFSPCWLYTPGIFPFSSDEQCISVCPPTLSAAVFSRRLSNRSNYLQDEEKCWEHKMYFSGQMWRVGAQRRSSSVCIRIRASSPEAARLASVTSAHICVMEADPGWASFPEGDTRGCSGGIYGALPPVWCAEAASWCWPSTLILKENKHKSQSPDGEISVHISINIWEVFN